MEKISFREILNESLGILKEDKKRFGIIAGVMTVLGILSEIFRGKALSTLTSLGSVAVFVLMSIAIVIICQKYIEKNYIIDTDSLVKKINAELGRSFLLILFEGAIILSALIIIAIPLILVLTTVGSGWTMKPSYITLFTILLFSFPLIIVTIFISYSLQYLLIKNNKIVESVQNSYYLVKNQFARAIVIGLKINLFYYLFVMIFFKVAFIGVFITNLLGIIYMIMNTFVFYKLLEENIYEI